MSNTSTNLSQASLEQKTKTEAKLPKGSSINDKTRLLTELWSKYVQDPFLFLWGNENLKGLCVTLDEHEHETIPAKPFPDRQYLREYLKVWLTERVILVFKSRQMMLTWCNAALILWDCLKPGRRWLVCCKTFDAANAILERMWFIYERLPKELRPKATRKNGFITIHHQDGASIIQAAAQSAEAPRSHTFSGILLDEMEFTDNAPALHTASMPTIFGGGKFVGVSTPNGKGYQYNLASDDGRIDLTWPPTQGVNDQENGPEAHAT